MKILDLAVVVRSDKFDPPVGTLVKIVDYIGDGLPWIVAPGQPDCIWPMPLTYLEIMPRFVTKQPSLARLGGLS